MTMSATLTTPATIRLSDEARRLSAVHASEANRLASIGWESAAEAEMRLAIHMADKAERFAARGQ
jgi:hypothetical protein